MKNIFSFLLVFLIMITSLTLKSQLDSTFGNNGKFYHTVSGQDAVPYAIGIQSNGKIITGGYSKSIRFTLVRYNQNGSLDNTFGLNGVVSVSTGTGTGGVVYDLVIQPDDKIVAVGNIYKNEKFGFMIMRFNADGTLDNTFGTGGKQEYMIGTNHSHGYGVDLQTDGKIVVSGYIWRVGGTTTDFGVLRLNVDGTLDTSFNNGLGYKIVSMSIEQNVAHNVKIQADNKIVLASYAKPEDNRTIWAIARLNPDGSMDETFNNDGRLTLDLSPTGHSGNIQGVAFQNDGKIILGGQVLTTPPGRFGYIVRLNNNGSVDMSFGQGGYVVTSVKNSLFQIVTDVLVQPDNKIVAAVLYEDPSSALYRWGVVRYWADGKSLDVSFGEEGTNTVVFNENGDDHIRAIALQNDGKVVACGAVSEGIDKFAIARFKAGNHLSNIVEMYNMNVSLYPNPATDIIHLSSNDILSEIVIHDYTGKMVMQVEINNYQKSIDVSALPQGLYIAKMFSKYNQFTKSIQIIR